jgi:hypothetical protein
VLNLGNKVNWEILFHDRMSEEAMERTVIVGRGLNVQ